MKNYTNTELKSIIENLPRLYVDADGSDVHRQEIDWIDGDLEIYAEVVCVKVTEAESITDDEDGYIKIYPPRYYYVPEITSCYVYFDGEELCNNLQIEEVVIPILEAKIYG